MAAILETNSDVALLRSESLKDLVAAPGLSHNLSAMGVANLHGTSSGNLIDLLRTGLIPTGQQKEVSFTGEMMGGILDSSLNHRAVSVVGNDQMSLAASYADRNLVGWEPSRSQQLMDLSEDWMRAGGTSEEVIAQWRPVRQAIENARLARWQGLTEDEQTLVRSPFPVICGILSSVKTTDTLTSIAGEKAIDYAAPSELVLFVPEEQLMPALALKEKYNSGCRICPASVLK